MDIFCSFNKLFVIIANVLKKPPRANQLRFVVILDTLKPKNIAYIWRFILFCVVQNQWTLPNQNFPMHFPEWNRLNFDENFTEFYS